MNEAYDQKPEKKMKSPVSHFVYKSLSLGFLLMITSCDTASVDQPASDKYSHSNVYICSPGGFWQQSYCALKV
jgi:hypothetical protein